MNTKKKIVLLAAFISLFLLINNVSVTYSKYRGQVNGHIESTVAKWNIKVNNNDVKSNTTLTNNIQATFPGSTHIKEGVIAPTSEGYFDIIIDATNTDVSFDYEISIVENEDIKDFVVYGYLIGSETDTMTDTTNMVTLGTEKKITNTMLLSDTNRIIKIRVYARWIETGGQMDNAADTAATTKTNVTLDTAIKFTQKV